MFIGITIFGLIIGLFLFMIGLLCRKVKMWVMFVGIIDLIIFGFIAFWGNLVVSGLVPLAVVGLITTIISSFLLYCAIKVVNDSKAENKLLVIGGTTLDRFFVECVLASCNDFSLEKNVAKAKLLADKYGLSYPNGIQALYKSALEAHKVLSSQIDSDRLSELRSVEEEEFNRLNRYVSFYGKNKRIAMLTDQMNELRKAAKSLDEGADMLMRSGQQKEIDWATWGGFVNGIAGSAAGMATAMDIQAQNAQIRAENEARRKSNMPAYLSISRNASENRSKANEIEKEIQLMKEKLIADTSTDDVMGMLEVSNATADVSATGACVITATVSAKSKLYIFGDVSAVADGSIVAHVCEDGQEIGTAYMVLPVNGVADSTGLVGMLLSGAHKEKKQTVTFSAGKLWLLEK